jgi:hypothetical protein
VAYLRDFCSVGVAQLSWSVVKFGGCHVGYTGRKSKLTHECQCAKKEKPWGEDIKNRKKQRNKKKRQFDIYVLTREFSRWLRGYTELIM